MPELQDNIPAPEIAPTEPQVPVDGQDAESKEWDEVTKEAYPDLSKKDDSAKDEVDPPVEEKKDVPAEPPKEEPPAEKEEDAPEEPTTNPAIAEARATQREIAEEFEAMKRDVAQELFKDLPTELKDADGDPIRGVEDVMKLVDPRTGVAFTEEAATVYLIQAKENLNRIISEAEKQADHITSINIALKDDSDRLQREFGEILKANPDVFPAVWAQYQKTLKLSPSGKMVVEAPVSLYEFTKTAVLPYVNVAKAQQEAAAAKDAAAKAQRSQDRRSRSDIFSNGKIDNLSDDEKEWAEVSKDYFGK